MRFDLEKVKLLILLIFTDFVFIILHILAVDPSHPTSGIYSLAHDRGIAEFFQYTKELWIAILILLVGIKRRGGLYLVFSLLFFYFLFDDALKFHESYGAFLANFLRIQPALGLRAVDFGELVVSGVIGLFFVLSIAFFFFLSDPVARKVGLTLVGMIVVLAGFGVLVDMVEIMASDSWAAPALIIIEEGGEMLVMSVITWFAFRLTV